MVVLKELIVNGFFFGQGMVVFKELSFNTFYFEQVWGSPKKSVLTVSTLGGCAGLQRTDL